MKNPIAGATYTTDPDATPEELRQQLIVELTKQAAGCLWILKERGQIGGDLQDVITQVLSLLDTALELETGQNEFVIHFTDKLKEKDPDAPRAVIFGNGHFEYLT